MHISVYVLILLLICVAVGLLVDSASSTQLLHLCYHEGISVSELLEARVCMKATLSTAQLLGHTLEAVASVQDRLGWYNYHRNLKRDWVTDRRDDRGSHLQALGDVDYLAEELKQWLLQAQTETRDIASVSWLASLDTHCVDLNRIRL